MEIRIKCVALNAEVICEHCGASHDFYLDDGDTYFNEDQMVDAIVDRLDWVDWDDGWCPDCVDERDSAEEDN